MGRKQKKTNFFFQVAFSLQSAESERLSSLLAIGYCFDVKQNDFIAHFISDGSGINVSLVFHP